MRLPIAILLFIVVTASLCTAKDLQIIWPDEQKPVLQFTVGPFHPTGVLAGGAQNNYSADIRVKNLSAKSFEGSFSADIYDKANAQIGDFPLWVRTLEPGAELAIPAYFTTVGVPNTLKIVPIKLPGEYRAFMPARRVALTLHSSPEGADVSVDGEPHGATPAVLDLTTGVHKVEFKKQGFLPYVHALVIQPDEASGGSLTIDLAASGDTVELRDGTVLVGDVESVNFRNVVVRIDGKPKSIGRNEVKRISLVERQMPDERK